MLSGQSVPAVRTEQLLQGLAGKRVLVTGGAGFVGSRVAHELVARGAIVTVLDDLSTGQRGLLPEGLAQFVQGSVTDVDTIDRCVHDAQLVFHLAVRNIIRSTIEPREDYEVNIGGTLNILLAAQKAPNLERVLYTSSVSIYGNPRALPITEEEGVNILSPYAASKLAGESYCSAFIEMYQMPITVVRYSNVYGAHQSPKNPYCGVVSKFMESCARGEPVQIHGSGLQTRDFTYIDDAVQATLLAALTPRAEGAMINVGSGRETTVRELADLVSQCMGVPTRIDYIDRRDIDNVQRRVVNIERARRMLRWAPTIDLTRGLAMTRDWLRGHRDGA
ncbi:MAG: NAD-dependent epimerase/dehydratase family protein [Gemmatimonadaceae bacterium]|nr:NAD-dependent epimerase/dehydratase family protein [Gemmatimonadaceae bacterium]